jgi:hypothetical protein
VFEYKLIHLCGIKLSTNHCFNPSFSQKIYKSQIAQIAQFFQDFERQSKALGCYAVNVQNAQFFQDFERQSRALGCYAVNVRNAQFF